MATFLEAANDFAGGLLCGFFTGINDLSPYWRGLRLRRGPVTIPVGSLGVELGNAAMAAFCPAPPDGFPPLSDGSAPGTGVLGDGRGECSENYAVVVRCTCEYRPGPVTSNTFYTYVSRYAGTLPGPLSAINFILPGPESGGIASNDTPLLQWEAGGSVFGIGGLSNDQPSRDKGRGINQAVGPIEWESINYLGPGDDDCGSPAIPPSGGPPVPGPETSGDLTFDDTNGNPITEPVTGTPLPPVLLPGGEIVVPVNIVGPTYNFNLNINLSTGDTSVAPASENIPDCCELPEGLESEPEENEEPEPEPEGEEIVTGVSVVVSSPGLGSGATQLGSEGGPDWFVPDLGVVMFAKVIGVSVFWSNPIRVQNRRCSIPCPFPNGAVAVVGAPRPGTNWQLFPEIATLE